jgi:O-methyltransferase
MSDLKTLYLNLMERTLLGVIYEDPPIDKWTGGQYNLDLRIEGLDWPAQAHTMIGFKRLRNIRNICEFVIKNNIPGDFIETGSWRGGACIYMRAILKAYECTDRTVWVADSFQGLPKPETGKYPADAGDVHYTYDELAVSLEQVRENFEKYDVLDEQVRFLNGWFKDTLPDAPIDKLSILRLDGDMYSSTIEAISPLYGKVVKGGFIIVDDYNAVEGCKKAITDFRERMGIVDPIIPIDKIGVYWQKT